MLYGRDAERALIGGLLDAARASRSGVLVVRGEPGTGKTALLEDAAERAGDMHVLRARGVESESELPFAGLHQLTRPALHLLDGLPAPQAAALAGALGLAERSGDDRFLVSAGCLSLLGELAERHPVLCLIDDVQWLDRPSTDALLFVARRLDAEGVVLLFATREGDGHRFEPSELAELELSGLDAAAAETLITRTVESELTPAVRTQLVERAAGNALALVELATALSPEQLAGKELLPSTIPVTREIERLFLVRVRRLSEPSQRLLALLAIDDTGRLEPLMRAAGALGIGADALVEAERARLVVVRRETIEARHPLIRSAVYGSLGSGERRAAHLALAEALTGESDADQRAWHRAAAALGKDAGIAAELERTAERARARSGHAAAAAALERAAELSTDAGARGQRLVAAAGAAWQGGRPEHATALLDRAAPDVADPRLRAELDHVRGAIEFRCGSVLDACATLMTGADAIATLDPRKALELLFDAALAAVDAGDYGAIAEAGQRAAALPRSGDGLLADLLAGVGSLVAGRSAERVQFVLGVVARADEIEEPRWLIWAAAGAGLAGDEAAEGAILRRAGATARASGAVDRLTMVLLTVTVNAVIAGRLGASGDAAEGLALARETGMPNAAAIQLAVLAWCAALQGRDEECRARAAAAAVTARPAGQALTVAITEWALALSDLILGRPDAAADRLQAMRDGPRGVAHPLCVLRSAPDLVEACVRSGRAEAAQSAYAVLEGFAQPGAPPWALALAARCRGLIAGDVNELAEAVRLHDRPLDRARSELLLGEQLRRRRRRTDARVALRDALETFEALGAAPWAERARAELRASGETARTRDPSTIAQLTPQELQVARYVAEGLTNKEVAAQLFLSPRTIDAHLRSVFAKLGVSSRTQLARVSLET